MKNPAAVALGTLGGQSKSPAKQAAARKNGKKGGKKKSSKDLKSPGASSRPHYQFNP